MSEAEAIYEHCLGCGQDVTLCQAPDPVQAARLAACGLRIPFLRQRQYGRLSGTR